MLFIVLEAASSMCTVHTQQPTKSIHIVSSFNRIVVVKVNDGIRSVKILNVVDDDDVKDKDMKDFKLLENCKISGNLLK